MAPWFLNLVIRQRWVARITIRQPVFQVKSLLVPTEQRTSSKDTLKQRKFCRSYRKSNHISKSARSITQPLQTTLSSARTINPHIQKDNSVWDNNLVHAFNIMSQRHAIAQVFVEVSFAKWQLKIVQMRLFFCYWKAGGQVRFGERGGHEKQLHSIPGSEIEGKRNIFWEEGKKKKQRNQN